MLGNHVKWLNCVRVVKKQLVSFSSHLVKILWKGCKQNSYRTLLLSKMIHSSILTFLFSFGVCCIFIFTTSGSIINQNNTYIQVTVSICLLSIIDFVYFLNIASKLINLEPILNFLFLFFQNPGFPTGLTSTGAISYTINKCSGSKQNPKQGNELVFIIQLLLDFNEIIKYLPFFNSTNLTTTITMKATKAGAFYEHKINQGLEEKKHCIFLNRKNIEKL